MTDTPKTDLAAFDRECCGDEYMTRHNKCADGEYVEADFARQLERELARATAERDKAISLLRAWVAGCGDEHYSTKDECRELLNRSGDFLATLEPLS